jgi:hypothetical protein
MKKPKEIFDMDPNSLHVFYDLEGPIIAFNRNGSLFFNLRFYLSSVKCSFVLSSQLLFV